jgi:hypothetical protein
MFPQKILQLPWQNAQNGGNETMAVKKKIAVVVTPDILVFLPMKLIAWQRRGDAYLSASFISRGTIRADGST